MNNKPGGKMDESDAIEMDAGALPGVGACDRKWWRDLDPDPEEVTEQDFRVELGDGLVSKIVPPVKTLAPARNRGQNEVGRELAAMTTAVQSWVDQFGVEYMRHQYAAECKKLQSKLSIIVRAGAGFLTEKLGY